MPANRPKSQSYGGNIPTGVLIVVGLVLIALIVNWFLSEPRLQTTMFSVAPNVGNEASRDVYNYGTGGVGGMNGVPYDAKVPQPTSQGPVSAAQRSVVRMGMLSILVSHTEDATHAISGMAERLGGYTEDSQIYEVANGVKNGYVAVRVPESKFATAMDEIRQLSTHVEKETTKANDVTSQIVDLDARLRNLRSEEKQYQDLMERTGTLADTLQIAQQLTNIRGQIEQLEAQQKYLATEVAMSKIMVNIASESDVEVFGVRWRPLYAFKQSLRALFAGVSDYVNQLIAFVVLLPLFLLWVATIGLFLYIFWKFVAWLRRKFLP